MLARELTYQLIYNTPVSVISGRMWTNMLSIDKIVKFFATMFKFEKMNRKLNFGQKSRINSILYSYNSLFLEINEYNTTYWSKFLFNIWFFFGIFIVFTIYIVFFTNSSLVMRLIMFYYLILLTSLYLFIMNISSSLNSEANKTYKLFNMFYSKFIRVNKRRKVFNCLKVCLIPICLQGMKGKINKINE